MGTRDNYRFTVQWGGDTADKVQAGNALKGMWSRKSRLIVAAVADYVRRYPDSIAPGHNLKANTEPPLTRSDVEEIVRAMIGAWPVKATPAIYNAADSVSPDLPNESDLEFMVENLDMFTATDEL